jgi:hypothetical protein
MNHPVRNARQAAKARGIVQITLQRGDATSAQQTHTFGRRSQRHQAHTLALRGTQLACGAQADVATTHNQDTLTAKSGGQCAQGSLV